MLKTILASILTLTGCAHRCDFYTTTGLCIREGEINRPGERLVSEATWRTIDLWTAQGIPRDCLHKGLRWGVVEFLDHNDLEMYMRESGKTVQLRGVTLGYYSYVANSGNLPLTLGVYGHEISHQMLSHCGFPSHVHHQMMGVVGLF